MVRSESKRSPRIVDGQVFLLSSKNINMATNGKCNYRLNPPCEDVCDKWWRHSAEPNNQGE